MGRIRRTTAIGAVVGFIGAATLLGATPAFAANTTYYVDAASGSDANAGTSTATAWKTLAKVNATTFGAGDKILLHTDQTWVEQLRPKGSGVAGNPITIGNYGGGAKPIVDGKNVAGGGAGGGAVYLVNQSYWTITGLEVTNDNGTNNITGSNRVGILVNNTSGALKSGITIQGNVVRRVNGCFVCNGADAHFNGGIAVIADPLSPLSTGASSYKDVRILDNVVDHVGRTGIIFGDWSTGLLYAVAYDALSKDITISGNTVTNVDSDGIVIGGAKYNQIDHNVVDNAGLVTVRNSSEPSSGGIWPTKARHTTIEYNEVSRVHTQSTDGQAFDVDLLADDTTLQYNYSHDNEGGFLLLEGGGFHGSGVTARYNLSVNDAYTGAKGVVTFALGVLPNSDIYNNTIYIAPGVPAKPFMQDGWSGTTSTAWSFRNNVVVNLGTGTWSTPTGAHAVVDHNLIHGNHTAGEPADANKITADPQMLAPAATAPAGIGNVSGYQLAATSPAAGSGAVIAGNGGQDFFGRPVSATAAPTRGFHEVN